MSYSCCNYTCCTTWQRTQGAAYAETLQWRNQGHAWDQVCVSMLFMSNPSNCDVVPHPVKICERRSVNGLTGQDLSRWYVAVVFTEIQPELWQQCEHVVIFGFVVCVIYRSIRLWMVAMLRWCEVTMFVGEQIVACLTAVAWPVGALRYVNMSPFIQIT
mgnify:CR=1 FL=1